MVLLKPYEKAIEDNDLIYAVIEGTGVNHEGGRGPIAQPTVEAQTALIQSVYDKYAINPENIAYIETHGTGTVIGDPIEYNALQNVFSNYTSKKQFCVLGTTKGNIGHTVSACGVIGLIKLIHVLRRGTAPPSTYFEHINPGIPIANGPFKIVTTEEKLAVPKEQLLGAVNAFGYVGSNAHLVINIPRKLRKHVIHKLEEKKDPLIFVFSARSYERLFNYFKNFQKCLKDDGRTLEEICSTLWQKNRLEKIVCFVSDSKATLLFKIKNLLEKSEAQKQVEEFLTQLIKLHHALEVQECKSKNIKESLLLILSKLESGEKVDGVVITEPINEPGYPFRHKEFNLDVVLPDMGHVTPSKMPAGKIEKEKPLEQLQQVVGPAVSLDKNIDVGSAIQKILANILQVAANEIDAYQSFDDLGIDSIRGVEFVEAINNQLGTNLPVTVIYDHFTLNSLKNAIEAQNLSGTVSQDEHPGVQEGSVHKEPDTAEQRDSDQDIAIIGIACRFPKSKDKDTFWKNLEAGYSAIDEIPEHRWSVDEFYDEDIQKPGKMNTRWGGFLEDYDKFDAEFFNISPKEALEMDPQQRLLMEEFWHVFEDAGYDPTQLPTNEVGTFTAAAHGDYVRNAERANYAPTGYLFIGNNLAILSARYSYFSDFQGPTLNVDTACSTSLVATHLACESLRKGECKIALVGGVCIFSTEYNFLYYTKSGMLSPEGKCKVFDDEGDGFVPGEGVGAILLKPLRDAVSDNDHIYSVIKASGINQDGKTKGITAPAEHAQIKLQLSIFQKANINPETIGYVETHGTGTKLGDPIEVEALTHSFGNYTRKKQFCYIGSVKSNLGHTIMTAGMAGLIKASLTIKHHIIPPTINVNTPNQYIDFDNSPFKLTLDKTPWAKESGYPRRAFVNAFGMSGTNAQVLLEEYVYPERIAQNNDYELFLLSALDYDTLEEQVKSIRIYLKENTRTHFQNIAYTLQVGRKHFPRKIAIIAKDVIQLDKILDDYLMDQHTNPLLFLDQTGGKKHSDDRYWQDYPPQDQRRIKKLLATVMEWFNEQEINWLELYAEQPYRVPLPGYPFKKDRYWIEAPKPKPYGPETLAAEKEVTVKRCIEETLGIATADSDPNRSLIEYGMDSISGLSLQSKLESAFSITIPVKDMFDNLTINKLEKYINSLIELTEANQVQENAWTYSAEGNITPDILKQESILPFDISAYKHTEQTLEQPQNYFITGSTGFLGAYLMHMLLERTSATIYCLIRSPSMVKAKLKLESNLKQYELWDDVYSKRIKIVLGDLGENKLGIKDEKYNDLASKIDCICHAGAIVNHILSYYDLKKINVDGTVEVIKFAATKKLKPIHFISAFGTQIRRIVETGEIKVHKPEEATQNAVGLEVGYSQSKWVAEQMLWQAQSQGLPVVIYRAGEITGSATMPYCRTDDMFHMLVKCFSELDTYPDKWPDGVIDIIPIDYATEAITMIMHHHYQDSGFYHLVHPHPCPAEKLFKWLNKSLKPMKKVSFDEWHNHSIEHINKYPENPTNRVLRQIYRDTPFGYRYTWYFKDYGVDIKHSQKILHQLKVKCPRLDDKLFENIFRYLFKEE